MKNKMKGTKDVRNRNDFEHCKYCCNDYQYHCYYYQYGTSDKER